MCTNTCAHREEGLVQKMLCPSRLLGVGQKISHEFLKKQKAENYKKLPIQILALNGLRLISSLERSMEKQNCQPPPVRLGGSNQTLELVQHFTFSESSLNTGQPTQQELPYIVYIQNH